MHQKPKLSNFIAVKTPTYLAVRLSIFLDSIYYNQKHRVKNTPIDAITRLKKTSFSLLIECFDDLNNKIFAKIYESNSFGNFFFKITDSKSLHKITHLKIYEIEHTRGVEYYLGSFRPLCLQDSPNIIISDFDKTLADTKYSTAKEIYQSLTKPLDFFPTVEASVAHLKEYTQNNFHPFILTASPHFYEDSIRDWLYANNIFTAGIFLKDFRKALSYIPADLSPKDLKIQGFYKLNQLFNIILMVGIPKELVLMGDNHESDPAIYATLALALGSKLEAWQIWKRVNTLPEFQFTNQQNIQILGKLYQIENAKKLATYKTKTKILIRALNGKSSYKLDNSIFKDVAPLIEIF